MRFIALIGCGGAVLTAACVGSPPPPPADEPRPPAGYELAGLEGAIVQAINDTRTAAGLPRLTVDSRLGQAARLHAANMAARNELSHTLSGTTTSTLVSRISDVGYVYRFVAENIAYGPISVVPLVRGWMQSPGHRANILNADYTETGVGVARSRGGVLFYCQVFGRPR